MDNDLLSSQAPSLFPDILTSEQLSFYVSLRYPTIRHIKEKSHFQLVELYRQMILPFPQREYRLNRRGKMLTKRRMERGLQDKKKQPVEATSCNNSNKTTVSKQPPPDRLKPPPESSRGGRIRLNSNSSCSESDSSSVKLSKSSKDEANTEIRKRHENSSHECSDVSKPKRVKITWP